MANRVYIASFNATLTPATPMLNSTFRIYSPGREIRLKSITVDWKIYDITTLQVLPPFIQITQSFELEVNPTQPEIGYAFDPTGGTVPQRNIYITSPGAQYFDGFFMANELNFELNIFNHPATNNVNHRMSIIVETAERTMFT